jgi:ABC-2 type transport system ATP-binding protein
MDKSPTVWARGITQSLGDVAALDGVDVEGTSGQIHGLAGLGDAGTTTLVGPAVADSGQLGIPGSRSGGRSPSPTASRASWTDPGSIRRSPRDRTSRP